MPTTTILASVKTEIMKKIQKVLAEKSISLVDTELNVEITDIKDLVEIQGVTVFGIYDEAEKKRLCGLFIGNSVKNNKYGKVLWKLKVNDLYPDEKKMISVKNCIEKAVPLVKIQIIVDGISRK